MNTHQYIPQPNGQQGHLFLLTNHIGNPQDLSSRVLEVLRSASLLVFEEHRPARSLLKTAGIHRSYLLLNEHQEEETLAQVKAALSSGQVVAYASDQGAPNLSDPGHQLTQLAYRMGVKATVIPGPCSVTAAISACPFPLPTYVFAGFPPREIVGREQFLTQLKTKNEAVIILDAPYRMQALLASIKTVYGLEQRVFVALDISGASESYVWTKIEDAITRTSALTPEGEHLNFVLIIPPGKRAPSVSVPEKGRLVVNRNQHRREQVLKDRDHRHRQQNTPKAKERSKR